MTTGLLEQVSRKMFLSSRPLMRIRKDLHLKCRIRLKMCVEMKENAQAHYFVTILAIPAPV